jgi:hypothetical protein
MKKISSQVILLTFLIVLAFSLGSVFKLFSKISWYDEFVHFIAGAWVAILIIWISEKINFPSFLKKLFKENFALTIITSTLIVGLVWELFEFGIVQYLLNVYEYKAGLQPSNLDTLSDLLMDILGAGLIVFIRKRGGVGNPHVSLFK